MKIMNILKNIRFNQQFVQRKTYAHLKEFSHFLGPYWCKGLLATMLMVIVALLNLPMPFLTGYIIDKVIGTGDKRLLNYIAILLIILSMTYIFLDYIKSYLLLRLRKMVLNDIRLKIFSHIQGLPLQYIRSKGTGYVMCQIRDDPNLLEGLLLDTILTFIQSVVTFIVGVIAIFTIHLQLALVSIFVLPFFVFSNTMLLKKIKQANRDAREKAAHASKILQESLSVMLVIKAFNKEKSELKRLASALKDEIESEMKAFILESKASRLRGFIGAMGPLIVVWYGGHEIINGNLTLGNMVAFSALLGYLYGPTRSLLGIHVSIQRALVSLERILDVLYTPILIQESKNALEPKSVRGDIRFQNVGFQYETERKILDDINFHIQAGTTAAILGLVGSGKTTLLNLLLRFYDPQEGSIYIDEYNIKDLSLKSLRNLIGYVSQEPFLFSTTIMENIRYGRDTAADEEVIEAAKAANAYSFIINQSNGFQTVIDERGANLSGGQKQMISLARVILRNPRILILDEPTASIDSHSEHLIQKTLDCFAKKRTTIIISHRLSTIHKADVIFVLHKGRIVGQGRHEELILANKIYAEIYNQQIEKLVNQGEEVWKG